MFCLPQSVRDLWPASPFLTSLLHHFLTSFFLSPLPATLMNHPASVANKRLTPQLSPLAATLTKTGGPPSDAHFSSRAPLRDFRTFKRCTPSPNFRPRSSTSVLLKIESFLYPESYCSLGHSRI